MSRAKVKTKRAKLSPKQYVERDGGFCPDCGSDQIEGEGVGINAGSSSQEISCLDCHASWIDVYQLIGYSFLNRSEK